MDAAALFDERKADVAAFATLLFQGTAHMTLQQSGFSEKRSRQARPRTPQRAVKTQVSEELPANSLFSSSSSSQLTPSTFGVTPAYRRPASANVPVSRVVQEAKARATRRLRIERTSSGNKKENAPLFTTTEQQASTNFASGLDGAFGFTAQQLRDRAYLCMAHASERDAATLSSAQDVSRAASKQGGALTPRQQEQLRRLRIKQRHQRVLSHAQWRLLLRRRRRLWQRRRPVARRRHVCRRLALQRGRTLPPCTCCGRLYKARAAKHRARKAKAKGGKACSAVRLASRITQWLPSHARLVKRFQHRVVSMVVPLDVTHSKSSSEARRGNMTRCVGAVSASQLRKRRATPIARLSVPVEPKRKGHRFLQRWATELGLQQRRSAHTHPATALGTTLVADLSHHCVYAIDERGTAGETPSCGSSCSSSHLSLDDVAHVLGLQSVPCDSAIAAATCAGVVLSVAPTARRQRLREAVTAVLHGHMWSATEDHRTAASMRSDASLAQPRQSRRQKRQRVSTVARHTRVVPVVLVAYTTRGSSSSSASSPRFLLFSEAPVLITRRAKEQLRVQLISAWNPCCRCPAFASMYEYWRREEPPLPEPSSRCASPPPPAVFCAARWVKSVLRRCARVYRRLRHRAATTRSYQKNAKAAGDSSSFSLLSREAKPRNARGLRKGKARKRHAAPELPAAVKRTRRTRTLPRFSLVVFPSLPPPFLLVPSAQRTSGNSSGPASAPYVWRVGLVYHPGEKQHCRLSAQRISECRSSPQATNVAKEGTNEKTEAPLQPHNTTTTVILKTCVEAASRRQPFCTSICARRAHFHLARRFFGFLLTTPSAFGMAASSDTRVKTRVLGLHERTILLKLVGRPAYPLDYGQSRPSAASQQRSRERQRTPARNSVTRIGAKRTRSFSSVSTTRTTEKQAESEGETSRDGMTSAVAGYAVVTFPSYVHALEYYGSLTNAGHRVTVMSAQADKKLPRLHSTVGCILLRCRDTTSTVAAAAAAAAAMDVVVVEQVGVISSSPLFAQRFGCVVAPVWCCLPPLHVLCADTSGSHASHPTEKNNLNAHKDLEVASVEKRQDGWSAASLLTPPATHTNMWFVLAPPEAAATLVRLSTSLQREHPRRLRASSRHQRAFDLARGRTARKLDTFLCDPTLCSPVQLIRWYA